MFLRGRNYFKFLYGETSASNQDAKTGTRFALLPKMMALTKCTKYIKQQFSKKLNIRQRRKLIQRWEAANLGSFTIVPVYKVKTLQATKWEGREPRGAEQSPWVGETKLGVRGATKCPGLQGRLPEESSVQKKNTENLQMIPLVSLADYWSAFVCEETTRVQGKNHPKGSKGKQCQGSHSWEECLFPPTTVKNLISHRNPGRVFRRVLLSS